ncbi:MAG TPA: tetratricopeptide repeat protein, partial [Verrucomicrobiae bacterium]|nr:tetratricopeptide repeat protein [Verrucomicrobiae bacterium]
DLEHARQLTPRSPFVHMSLGLLAAREGHLEEALAAANEAVRLRPDYARAHLLLGNVLAKSGRTEEAAAAYQRAAALDPRDSAPRLALARLTGGADQDERLMSAGLDALRAQHDPERAGALFREVLAHTPTHYGATYQLAAALDAAGRPSEARPVWEKMLAMAEAAQDEGTVRAVRQRLETRP